MGNFESLFSGVNFQNTIKQCCDANKWKTFALNEQYGVLKFDFEGYSRHVFIYRYDQILEFSIPSNLDFPSEAQVPHYLSTILLKRNTHNNLGFWCIVETDTKHYYSYMHNMELSSLKPQSFRQIVLMLLKECEDFENLIAKILQQQSQQ